MFKLKQHQSPIFVEDENFPHHKPKKLRLRYVLLLIITVAASVYWQRAEAGVEQEEVTAGQLLFKSETTGQSSVALLQSSEVHFKVSGLVAHVSLKQHFHNDSQEWVEGVYSFPLPDKAAVNRLRMVIGERVIEGEIKEKEEAKKIYQQAKKKGKKASLLNQQRPNLFTSRIANIAPGETIVVHLEYIEKVAYDDGQFSLRFPMTITPRYIPGNAVEVLQDELPSPVNVVTGWALNTDQVPDADQITPPLSPLIPSRNDFLNPVTITAELDMGMPLQVIESAYHNIVLSRKENRYSLRLREGRVAMEQDFVLNWRPSSGKSPRMAVFSEPVQGEDYALLMVVPPESTLGGLTLPREAIYIIDTSGSMDGVSIKQAKQSLLTALDQLSPRDRFNIIEFNSTTHTVFDRAVMANSNNLDYARRYVKRLQSRGGTEMLPALTAALRDDAEEGFIRQVIFITDGAVGNESELFAIINQQLGNSRLFTIGIGSAPNSYFMRKAAQFGRGSFTQIGDTDEVQQKMTALFNKLDSPLVSDIKISWPGGAKVESYPERIPDLYRGEPLVVSAKMSDVQGVITISGKTAGKPWQQRVLIDRVQQHSGVSTLWAREKVASLLDEKIAGRDKQAVRDDVIDVAITHQLVTPYTSFVAVEQLISRPGKTNLHEKRVLNLRPKGQGAQHFAFPQTATAATQSLLWGGLLMLVAWAFNWCLRKEVEYGLLD